MSLTRRLAAVSCSSPLALATACGSDSNHDGSTEVTDPVIGVTATRAVVLVRQGHVHLARGDNSYTIERAEGAAGTFAQAGTVTAPATPGTVTYTDNGLKVNTQYRYRVITDGRLASRRRRRAKPPRHHAQLRQRGRRHHHGHHGEPHALRRHRLHAQGLHPRRERRDAHDPAGHEDPGRLQHARLVALHHARRQDSGGRHRRPPDRVHVVAPGRATASPAIGAVCSSSAMRRATAAATSIVEGTGTDGTQVVGGKNYEVTYSGGTVATDNSGTLQYVRVEFAGFAPSLNNEFNAFTFAAVGSGTRLSYLQSHGAARRLVRVLRRRLRHRPPRRLRDGRRHVRHVGRLRRVACST